MTAVLMGLRAVTEANRPVIVRSDSEFVIRTLCGRYRRHKNFDLWKDIDREVARFSRIRFEWVRGHAGDVHNEAADKLANAGAAQAPHPDGAPPAPTTQPRVRKARSKRERRSRLRCSRCNTPVRKRRRFPGQLRCRCGFIVDRNRRTAGPRPKKSKGQSRRSGQSTRSALGDGRSRRSAG